MNQIVLSGASPPLPKDGGKSSSAVGQNLLVLLRTYEKNRDDLDAFEQVVTSIQRLISITHRRGLLQGDETAAEKVLAMDSCQTTKQGGGGVAKKRRGGRSDGLAASNDLAFLTDSAAEGKVAGPALDGQLIMLAILRILSPEKLSPENESLSSDDCTESNAEDRMLLKALAADLCTSICGFILSRSSSDTCTVAEYELIASSGKQLLSNLEVSARTILQKIPITDGGLRVASLDREEDVYALKACLQACSALVSLFGTKLSRSTKVLACLCGLCWDCLAVSADGVCRLAAKLVASLPLAGGTDNITPSDSWNQSLREVVAAANQTFRTVAPINTSADSSANKEVLRDHVRNTIEQQIDKIRRSSSETARADSFLHLVQGLVAITTSLLACDSFGVCGSGQFINAQVDMESILGLVETMLSFPLVTEATFHGTKKRLRSEAVDGGLISVSTLAGKVANQVKLYGYELLECILDSLGGATLLPYARRILRISHAALLTSSSATVRRAVDPASEMNFSGKRQRWLHNAISVRTTAVRVFRMSLLAFGSDPTNTQSTSRHNSISGSRLHGQIEKSINLVCGCLLEELTLQKTPQQQCEDWGSLDERAELVRASAECLAAALASSGEYVSLVLRKLLDSVVSICLSSIHNCNRLCTFADVKASFLGFATSCAATPWQDGAASSITSELLRAARFCQKDEAIVVQASDSAIRLCEALAYSRAPALIIVTRSDKAAGEGAQEVIAQMLAAQSEIDHHRDAKKANEDTLSTSNAKHYRDSVLLKHDNKKAKLGDEGINGTEGIAPSAESNAPAETKPEPHPAPLPPEEVVMHTEKKLDSGEASERAVELEKKSTVENEAQNDDSDDEFPAIVDCGPDEDDE